VVVRFADGQTSERRLDTFDRGFRHFR
jgi:hypothetical protein